MKIINPYASVAGHWFKGNTHLHPLESGESLPDAIREGNFYATQGPRFERIRLEDRELIVHTSSVGLVQFRGRNFGVLAQEDGAHVK